MVIELTQWKHDGSKNPVYVNPDKICFFVSHDTAAKTEIRIDGITLYVNETVEEVKHKLCFPWEMFIKESEKMKED